METFVVHIHRRTGSGAGQDDVLAGIVERTDSAVSRPFVTLVELLALLGVQPPAVTPSRQRSRSKS